MKDRTELFRIEPHHYEFHPNRIIGLKIIFVFNLIICYLNDENSKKTLSVIQIIQKYSNEIWIKREIPTFNHLGYNNV